MSNNYLKIDYDYHPAKGHIYKQGTLVKKWSIDKPIDIIHKVIDSTDLTGFDKIKMKKQVNIVLNIFEPKTIKIIEKE